MSSHGAVVLRRCALIDEFRHPEGFGNKLSTGRAIPNGNDNMNSTIEQLLLSAKGTFPARLPNALHSGGESRVHTLALPTHTVRCGNISCGSAF
jgi:hypothetical protein